MKKIAFLAGLVCLALSCTDKADRQLRSEILNNPLFDRVDQMAWDLASTGYNAGDNYAEIWIRDLNTFIELSMEVHPLDEIKDIFTVFMAFQGPEGDIIDGYALREKAYPSYKFRECDLLPQYVAHKNTVETDQEASFVQAVYKFVKKSGDTDFLKAEAYGKTTLEHLEWALQYLRNCKWNDRYGLITGATTVDWGDIQPEHEWGVEINENTHFAIDIYDNAMFVEAIDNYVELCRLAGCDAKADEWLATKDLVAANVRKHLWDSERHKFIPHIYLNGSPFPADFDENALYYHGGTAVAIEAGLLTKEEIAEANAKMLQDVAESGVTTIGITVYPPYPEGYFLSHEMHPYTYQNAGDWTWFGGRMIIALINNGFVREAYDEVLPMLQRVADNGVFNEWYARDGKAVGSGTYRGEAGVLFKSIELLRAWAQAE